MQPRSLSEAIMGSFDGGNTAIGLVAGLLAGVTVSGMFKVALTVAVAALLLELLEQLRCGAGRELPARLRRNELARRPSGPWRERWSSSSPRATRSATGPRRACRGRRGAGG